MGINSLVLQDVSLLKAEKFISKVRKGITILGVAFALTLTPAGLLSVKDGLLFLCALLYSFQLDGYYQSKDRKPYRYLSVIGDLILILSILTFMPVVGGGLIYFFY